MSHKGAQSAAIFMAEENE